MCAFFSFTFLVHFLGTTFLLLSLSLSIGS